MTSSEEVILVPRHRRVYAESGVEHIVIRGVGRMVLFDSDEDRWYFLGLMQEAFNGCDASLVAWCLMGNHVHLLVRSQPDDLSRIMHQLCMRYAQYFNRVTGHTGHVFESRFFNQPISTDSQLLAAVRYIHLNPVKAGIAAFDAYRWSSHREYVGERVYVDADDVLELLGGVSGYRELMSNADMTYEMRLGKRTPDEDCERVARSVLDVDPSGLKALGPPLRNARLRTLHAAGLSVRQIAMLTGIGSKTVSRAMSQRA
jgi:putative transposase